MLFLLSSDAGSLGFPNCLFRAPHQAFFGGEGAPRRMQKTSCLREKSLDGESAEEQVPGPPEYPFPRPPPPRAPALFPLFQRQAGAKGYMVSQSRHLFF